MCLVYVPRSRQIEQAQPICNRILRRKKEKESVMGHPFSCSLLHAYSQLATFLRLLHPFSCPMSFVRLGKETVQQAIAFSLMVVYHECVMRASASFCPPKSVKVNETLVFSLVVMFKSTVPAVSFVKLTVNCLNYVKQHRKPSYNIRLRCLFHVKRRLV